jgi:uncharacterized protein YndB with AHSA1/START domain
VDTVSFDLDARYAALTEARRVAVGPEGADITITRELPAPPHVVWEWLNDPVRRRQWDDITVQEETRQGGRGGGGDVTVASEEAMSF